MKAVLLFLQAVLLLATIAAARAQTLTLNKSVYETGQDIIATWTGGPGNPRDWVGIYQEGQTPGSVASTLWFYVNGTGTATAGLTDGSLTFSKNSLAPGNYVAHFLADNGYTAIAGPVPFTVEGVAFTSFTADAKVISPGTTVILSWVIDPNGLPTPTATLTGGPAPVDVTGMDSIEVTPAATTTYTLTVGTTASRSVNVGVLTGNSASFSLDATTLTAGTPLTATWSGGPANATDWVGIYRMGDTPGPVVSTLWAYTNGTRTIPATGLAAGTVSFPATLAPGEYFAAFFLNDGYTIAFGPVAFTVTAAPFAIRDFAILDTGEITLTWASDPNAAVYFNVQESTDLKTWTTVEAASFLPPDPAAGTTSITFQPVQPPTAGSRFYRIQSTDQ